MKNLCHSPAVQRPISTLRLTGVLHVLSGRALVLAFLDADFCVQVVSRQNRHDSSAPNVFGGLFASSVKRLGTALLGA